MKERIRKNNHVLAALSALPGQHTKIEVHMLNDSGVRYLMCSWKALVHYVAEFSSID